MILLFILQITLYIKLRRFMKTKIVIRRKIYESNFVFFFQCHPSILYRYLYCCRIEKTHYRISVEILSRSGMQSAFPVLYIYVNSLS